MVEAIIHRPPRRTVPARSLMGDVQMVGRFKVSRTPALIPTFSPWEKELIIPAFLAYGQRWICNVDTQVISGV